MSTPAYVETLSQDYHQAYYVIFFFIYSLSLSLSLHNLECILFIYLFFINLSTLHLILVLFDAALKKD